MISTKFTWPHDADPPPPQMPPGGYVLTAEKEALWRKWVDLYKAHMLPKGEYMGELYDIGFDRPEAHAIANPLMLHIPTADHFVGPDAQAAIHAELDPHPKVTLHDYPGLDHGFAAEMGNRRETMRLERGA